MATIEFIAGPRTGERLDLTGELVIGREGCDVVIGDARISRRHVAIRPQDDGVEIEDLGSSNGTFVDDRKIDAAVRVTASAMVRLGATVLRIELDDRTRAAATVIGEVGRGGTVIGSSVPAQPPAGAPAVAKAATPAVDPPATPRLAAFPAARQGPRARVARSWLPTVVAVAIVAATAAALIVYFAMR